MDWTQIEKDFVEEFKFNLDNSEKATIFGWFKHRIEAEMPPEKLTEEEKNEFYTTSLTADIKANYGK